MHDGERKAGGDGGVHSVAAGTQDVNARARSRFVHADHDGMPRVHRAHGRGRGKLKTGEEGRQRKKAGKLS
jgi:hypothetical protein